MLGIDQLLPEIFLGVGLAVAIGSAIALFRRGGSPLPKNPSERPRSLPPELRSAQNPGNSAESLAESEAETNSKTRAGMTSPPVGVRLYTLRTIFFLVIGLLTALWGLATILARG